MAKSTFEWERGMYGIDKGATGAGGTVVKVREDYLTIAVEDEWEQVILLRVPRGDAYPYPDPTHPVLHERRRHPVCGVGARRAADE